MRILIVEDEVRLAENIAQLFREKEKYAVDVAFNGEDGFHLLTSNTYDLAVLDWMLPVMNGLQLLQKARQKGVSIPILFLTARDSHEDIISALDSGSDDYLTKPFDMGELLARCKALIRRSFGVACSKINCGRLEIDTAAKKVFFNGKYVELPALEYSTIEYLALKPGHVISKEQLLEHLYDYNWEKFSNVIEVYISNLRKKLDPEKKFNPIKTLRGQGYMLEKNI